MKKLLGILGTIIISGSGISGIVGNAPARIEENNLEKINRNKRNYEKCNISDVNANTLNKDGSTFTVKYKALWHDDIYAKLSYSFAQYAGCAFTIFKTKDQYIYNVVLMLQEADKVDKTGSGGSIKYSDYSIVASVIWDNITFFTQQIQKTQYELSGHYGQKIEIHTDRIGTFNKLNPENNIYFVE